MLNAIKMMRLVMLVFMMKMLMMTMLRLMMMFVIKVHGVGCQVKVTSVLHHP